MRASRANIDTLRGQRRRAHCGTSRRSAGSRIAGPARAGGQVDPTSPTSSCRNARSCWPTICCRRSSCRWTRPPRWDLRRHRRPDIACGDPGRGNGHSDVGRDGSRRAGYSRGHSARARCRRRCAAMSTPIRRTATAAEKRTMAAPRTRALTEREAAQRECRTADGVRIEMFANVGSVDRGRAAAALGAEGCGLLRTEFLFLDRAGGTRRGRAGVALSARSSTRSRAGQSSSARSTSAATSRSPYIAAAPRGESCARACAACASACSRPELLREQLTRHPAGRRRRRAAEFSCR